MGEPMIQAGAVRARIRYSSRPCSCCSMKLLAIIGCCVIATTTLVVSSIILAKLNPESNIPPLTVNVNSEGIDPNGVKYEMTDNGMFVSGTGEVISGVNVIIPRFIVQSSNIHEVVGIKSNAFINSTWNEIILPRSIKYFQDNALAGLTHITNSPFDNPIIEMGYDIYKGSKPGRIAIVGAMQVEIDTLLGLMENPMNITRGHIVAHVGTIHGVNVVLCRCGVGKVSSSCVTATLIEIFPDIQLVINLGVAGSVGPDLEINDIVIVNNSVQHDFDQTALGRPLGQVSGFRDILFASDANAVSIFEQIQTILPTYKYHTGIAATGDIFVANIELKSELWTKFGALEADMETAAIAQICTQRKIPFAALRAMSDSSDGTAPADFNEFVREAAKRSSETVAEFLKLWKQQ